MTGHCTKMRSAIIAGVAFAATAAAQTPPVEFKGVPMGATRTELLSKWPEFRCYPSGCRLVVDEVRRAACAITDTPCWLKVVERFRFGPAQVRSYDVDFRGDLVSTARIVMSRNWYPQLVIALTEKYGPPHKDATDQVQNRMGAKFDNRTVSWAFPTGTIKAEERGLDIDTSMVTMSGPGVEHTDARETVDKAKASAKAL